MEARSAAGKTLFEVETKPRSFARQARHRQKKRHPGSLRMTPVVVPTSHGRTSAQPRTAVPHRIKRFYFVLHTIAQSYFCTAEGGCATQITRCNAPCR